LGVDFGLVVSSFLSEKGLPLGSVLPAGEIERIFRRHDGSYTTLPDPKEYTAEMIAELYGYRWNVELDIRQIKQTLNLDHLRCKTPEMVRKEFWITLLAYNPIRGVICEAARPHRTPRAETPPPPLPPDARAARETEETSGSHNPLW